MNTAITIQNLKKQFGGVEIFQNFHAKIEEGEITTVFGPNGSGKSTLLNILSGIIPKDSGNIHIKNFDLSKFSYIFQNYRDSLLPWRTNFENVALPLQLRGRTKDEINKEINELQKIFRISFGWNSYPYELSGGQQQILAFMRALITRPEILFIDEPFSALDYENNLMLRNSLQKYHQKYRPTIILITHNIEEAIHLGKNILVLSKKPTTVIKTIDNTTTYPRTADFLKMRDFHLTKEKILSIFQKTLAI